MEGQMAKPSFKPCKYVVYPAHGVGRVVSIEESIIDGDSLRVYVVRFDANRLTLRIPVHKAISIGLRSLSSPETVTTAFHILKQTAAKKNEIWGKQEKGYKQKINSGDLIAIAEVVRDLHHGRTRNAGELSYTAEQLYDIALARLSQEIAVVESVDENSVVERITNTLGALIRPGVKRGSQTHTSIIPEQAIGTEVAPASVAQTRDTEREVHTPKATPPGVDPPPRVTVEDRPKRRVTTRDTPTQVALWGSVRVTRDQIPGGERAVIEDGVWIIPSR